MEKDLLKKKIQNRIQEKAAIEFLEALIRLPSESAKPVYAQELVRAKLSDLGFSIDCFPCETDKLQDLTDFCRFEENNISSPDIYNLAATLKGETDEKRLMLFSHIDTSPRSEVMPDFCTCVKDGKLYGLGAADAKGGIAMIVQAVQAVLQEVGEIKNSITILSTIGKRGSVGTLTAVQRGYYADAAVYLHPAETGHGFREIKNYSMGAMDFTVEVKGRPGVFRDEIDDSEVSAITKGSQVIQAIEAWNRDRRENHFFEEGSFKGLPNTKVNFLTAESSELYREDALHFEIKCRMCFGLKEKVEEVMAELKTYLKEYFADDSWFRENPPQVQYGELRATPAYVSRTDPLILDVEKNIENVTGNKDFIYQYHASSDIRLPIVYGATPTVGIGPKCGGLNENNQPEWLDIQDYIDGIKITAGMIVDWCL